MSIPGRSSKENADACGTTEVLESSEIWQDTWACDILFSGFNIILALLEWVEQSFNNHLSTFCSKISASEVCQIL